MNCLKERKWAHWRVTPHHMSLDDTALRVKRRTQGWLITNHRKCFVQSSLLGSWETDSVVLNLEHPIIIQFKPRTHQETWERVLAPLQKLFHFQDWKKKICPQKPIKKKFIRKINKESLRKAFLNWQQVIFCKNLTSYPVREITQLNPWRIICKDINPEYLILAKWKWPKNPQQTFTCACRKQISFFDSQGYTCGHFFHHNCLQHDVIPDCPQCQKGKRLNNSYTMLPIQESWVVFDQVFFIIGPYGQYWKIDGSTEKRRQINLKYWIQDNLPTGNMCKPIQYLAKWYRKGIAQNEKWKWMTTHIYYRLLPIAWNQLCIAFDATGIRAKKLKLINIAMTFAKVSTFMKEIGILLKTREPIGKIMSLLAAITEEILPFNKSGECNPFSQRIRNDTKTQAKFFENVITHAVYFESILKQFTHRALEASDASTKRYLSDFGTGFDQQNLILNLFYLRNFFQFLPLSEQDSINHIVDKLIVTKFTEETFQRRTEKRWLTCNFVIIPKPPQNTKSEQTFIGIITEYNIEHVDSMTKPPTKTVYHIKKFITSVEESLRIPLTQWLYANCKKLTKEEESEVLDS